MSSEIPRAIVLLDGVGVRVVTVVLFPQTSLFQPDVKKHAEETSLKFLMRCNHIINCKISMLCRYPSILKKA